MQRPANETLAGLCICLHCIPEVPSGFEPLVTGILKYDPQYVNRKCLQKYTIGQKRVFKMH